MPTSGQMPHMFHEAVTLQTSGSEARLERQAIPKLDTSALENVLTSAVTYPPRKKGLLLNS